MDGWYYRTFDIDFGPVSHEKLVELIKAHSISRDDQVRFGANGGWRRVGSIGTLMAHLPFEDVAVSQAKRGSRGDMSAIATLESPSKSARSSDSSVAAVNPKPDGNQWWCQIHDEIFGPVDMPKLVEMVKSQVISREDQVRFGETGIWRRVGSIGPLMAHLPFEIKDKVAPSPVRKGPSDGLIDTVNEDTAEASGAGSSADNGSREIEDRWWCRINEREYGPVELTKVVEWAATGRLLKTDEVRFGRDPYVAAGQLAGLFPEEPKPAVAEPTPPKPATPAPKPPEAVQESPKPAPSESAPTPASSSSPSPATSSGGFSSPGASAQRPKVPFRPPVKAKSGGGDLVAKLLPIGLGVGGVAVVGALIYFGIMMLPESNAADIKRLELLQTAFGQIDKIRKSGGKTAAQFSPVKELINTAGKTVVAELKDIANKKPNQSKLNYLAKKMQDLSKAELGEKPSEAETALQKSLSELEAKLKPK